MCEGQTRTRMNHKRTRGPSDVWVGEKHLEGGLVILPEIPRDFGVTTGGGECRMRCVRGSTLTPLRKGVWSLTSK